MDLETKRTKLATVYSDFENSFRKVENIGTMFFLRDSSGCVLRDLVYRIIREEGIFIEVLALNQKPYFVGSKKRAIALFEAFGGKYDRSECCHYMTAPEELWIWEPCEDLQAISKEDAITVLF